MSLLLTWFKEYRVEDKGYIKVDFLDGGDYSFCGSNANALMRVFGQVRNIPKVGSFEDDDYTVNVAREVISSKLISPNDMVEICETLLSDVQKFIEPYFTKGSMDNVDDLVEYVSMIKDKSEQGYYVVFETE